MASGRICTVAAAELVFIINFCNLEAVKVCKLLNGGVAFDLQKMCSGLYVVQLLIHFYGNNI